MVTITIALNRSYVDYCCVMLLSLVEHADRNRVYEIFLLDRGDIDPQNLEKISNVLEDSQFVLRVISVSQLIENLNLNTHWYFSKDIYLRLLIPSLITNRDRIIYIDCDMIFERDIGDFFDLELSGFAIGGVRDPGVSCMIAHEVSCKIEDRIIHIKDYIADLGLGDGSQYINSGVLLMDLKALRFLEFTERSLALVQRTHFVFPDQESFAIFLGLLFRS